MSRISLISLTTFTALGAFNAVATYNPFNEVAPWETPRPGTSSLVRSYVLPTLEEGYSFVEHRIPQFDIFGNHTHDLVETWAIPNSKLEVAETAVSQEPTAETAAPLEAPVESGAVLDTLPAATETAAE